MYVYDIRMETIITSSCESQNLLGSPGREAASTLSCQVTPSVPLITNKKQTKKKIQNKNYVGSQRK